MATIETPWGKIKEGVRDPISSNAIVELNPDATKPAEIHERMTEIFTWISGYGAIIVAGFAREFREGCRSFSVKPGEDYTILNCDPEKPLVLSVKVTPPFNPSDVRLVNY